MGEWPRVKVKEVCSLIVDCVNKTAPVVDFETQYRMIRTTNVRNGRIDLSTCRFVEKDTFDKWTRRASVIDGDVILTREAPIGEVGYVKDLGEVFLGQRIMQYRADKSKIDPRFMFYAFRSPELQHQFGSHDGSGSVVSHIRVADCQEFLVPLAPHSQQIAIGELLGVLDDKIDLNRRMNETLEQTARALFKDWFVDFGPTKAKMAGQAAYLEANLWDLFPERLDEAGVPDGWSEKPFGELIADNIGGDWGKEAPEEPNIQPVSIIRGTDMPSLHFGEIGSVPTRYTTEKKLRKRELRDGDIVIEVSGGSPTQPTGRSIYITETVLRRFPRPVVCASFCRRFRPVNFNTGILLSEHLSNLYSYGGTWQYQNQSTGIANFQTKRFLESEKVIWPGEAVIERFAEAIEPLLRMSTLNESLILAQTRDLLLPKLMSGELRVRDAEAKVAEVL